MRGIDGTTLTTVGVPIIGVGLLYRSGYFSQSLSRDGWQLERYPTLREKLTGGRYWNRVAEAELFRLAQ